jgi:hypothetical protein
MILLALAATSPWWGRALWLRAQVAYWQQRCMNYVAPADVVVAQLTWFDEFPADRPITSTIPREWSEFYQLVSPPGFQSGGTLFLHEMRRPSGERILVAVDYTSSTGWNWGHFQIRTFQPAKGWNLPRQIEDKKWRLTTPLARGAEFFAGQIDPADPTHFTARYRAGDVEYVIDGWVRADTVDLESRAVTQPTTSSVCGVISTAGSTAPRGGVGPSRRMSSTENAAATCSTPSTAKGSA